MAGRLVSWIAIIYFLFFSKNCCWSWEQQFEVKKKKKRKPMQYNRLAETDGAHFEFSSVFLSHQILPQRFIWQFCVLRPTASLSDAAPLVSFCYESRRRRRNLVLLLLFLLFLLLLLHTWLHTVIFPLLTRTLLGPSGAASVLGSCVFKRG